MAKKWQVNSPDGFAIRRETQYDTEEQARADLAAWVKGFEHQGYYSTSDRTRLTLEELPHYCEVFEEDEWEEDEDDE